MVIKIKENSFGAWAFLIGVVLAIMIGISASFFSMDSLTVYSSIFYGILVILGLVVGFSMNARGKDGQNFLLAGAVIVIVSGFGMESVLGSLLGLGIGKTVLTIFAALLALFVPATIVVAIKTVFGLARI